jgi:hypothetical protein
MDWKNKGPTHRVGMVVKRFLSISSIVKDFNRFC